MTKQEIIWYSFERDAVPYALNGSVDVRPNGPALNFGAPRPRDGDIVLAFSERPSYQQRIVPLLIVMNESSTADVLSWLSTYTPESFPLSQFARVISEKDWELFNFKDNQNFSKYEHEDRWASLILGELLAQGEGDAELASIPFSRASACFSTSVARASLIYPRQTSALSTCISRLQKIEGDTRFIRRPVSVSELAKVWGALQHHEYRRDDYYDSADARISEAISLVLAYQGGTDNGRDTNIANYPGLTSNSMEERVRAFQKLVADATLKSNEGVADSRQSAFIAAAAFLVGRSTSHIFLLRRISRAFPSAILWFGAIAAVSGPKSWDPHWQRAVKGIEKQLRIQFHWGDPTLSDLCWHEYEWLSSVFKGGKVFETLSKNTPNVISVEIVPGASCQMRLSASFGKSVDNDKAPAGQRETKSEREAELEAFVAQVLSLASKAQDLLPPKNVKNKYEHPSLFKDDPVLSSKAPRKKVRGGSGFDR